MSTLYIRLPSKAAADNAPHWLALPCPYALTGAANRLEREGVGGLSSLGDFISKAQRVVLLLAASDVTLLRVKVPPMSSTRLKSALPNLVEDQLMSDPAECVVIAGPLAQGLRTVAVVSRNWLGVVAQAVSGYGARNLTALPSQLCLPYQDGQVSAALFQPDSDIDLTVRLSEFEGIGLPIMPEQNDSAARDAIAALLILVPERAIELRVPAANLADYQQAIGAETRLSIGVDQWPDWIAGADAASGLNLMAGMQSGGGTQFNWRPWRWPLGLAAAVLLANIVGLNTEWWRMKREAGALQSAMLQTYKSTFPKDTVVVDPVAQINQKIVAAQREAGLPAPDDFLTLAAAFGEAWAGTGQGQPGRATPIAALEYRERSLFVKIKAEADVPLQPIKTALAARKLSLTQTNSGLWQIRSEK